MSSNPNALLERVANSPWYLYLLRCRDGSLYTGISTDVGRRLAEHNGEGGSRRGARALRGRRPAQLVFILPVADRIEASRLEYRIKRLSRTDKEALIRGQLADAGIDLKAQTTGDRS